MNSNPTLTKEQALALLSGFNFCWDEKPVLVLGTLRKMLELHRPIEGKVESEEFNALVPNEGLRFFVRYWLEGQGLTEIAEIGASVNSAVLSDEGEMLLNFLAPLSNEELDQVSYLL